MKSFYQLLIFITFLNLQGYCQGSEDHELPFHFTLGTQIRVTPIYVKKTPEVITLPDRNIWEQPDMHLSGTIAFVYGLEKEVSNSLLFRFSQSIRYGLLHWTHPFTFQQRDPYLKTEKKRAFVSDVYFDLYKKYALNSSDFYIGAGFSVNGLGTGYLLTQRFLDNNNQSFYVTTKENYMFPAVSASLGWQKGKFDGRLRMGYCWNNPTMFDTPFLFPELGVNYRLFSF